MKTKITAKLAALMGAVITLVALSLTAVSLPVAEVANELAAAGFNSGGNQVFAEAQVSDGTGVVTTIAAAGTYVTVGTAAPLAAGDADGSGCLTYTLASNMFNVAKSCGAGKLLLTACLNDVIGANSAVVLGAWHRVRATVTTVASPISRETEGATAARNTLGCNTVVVDAQLADTYDFRYDSNTNADTVTTRQANFTVRKISSL